MESAAMKTMQEVEATTLKAWMERGEAVLVDVREPPEHAAEHIPGSRLLPLSTFDPARVPQETGKKVVLHCVMGARSAQAGQKLLDAGFTTVYNFRGGVQAWKDAGYTTARDQRAPISLQRQVQIVSGSLILLGTVLGAAVSPWFLLLSGGVGAGLVYAGVSDTCGMAMLLAQLPYNRRS
jgi:rhodanese-related sulfurtransferase